MLKKLLSIILLVNFTFVQPALATPSHPESSSYKPWTYVVPSKPKGSGRPSGLMNPGRFPDYSEQIKYIKENLCDATGIDLYRGNVFYICPSGEEFWADVLVPSEFSPLFMYFKNRKKHVDEIASGMR